MLGKASYYPKLKDIHEQWFLIDARERILGRLASQIAGILIGKKRRDYAPSVNSRQFVVVVNADEVVVTGKKREQKKYYSHSKYAGGFKIRQFREITARSPEQIVHLAVKGMLPKNKLRRVLLQQLKIYRTSQHPHSAQRPVEVNVTAHA